MLFGLVVFPGTSRLHVALYFWRWCFHHDQQHPNGRWPAFITVYRYCNGRVWVELLAQQLNLTNNYWYSNNISNHLSYTNLSASSTNWSYSSNNWSFFGHYSSILVTNINNFAAPPDASNALFIVWVNDADFVDDMATIYSSLHFK